MRARPPEYSENSVFLNVPYDGRFRNLLLAYVAGLVHLGLHPHALLEVSCGPRRLDKIFELISSCRYSIHDLSRVQLDRHPPCTPRFNMPFELGLAIGMEKLHPRPHTWFVFEAVPHRLAKSLSDLTGYKPHLHGESAEGVMRALSKAFIRRPGNKRFAVSEMMKTFRALLTALPQIEHHAGSSNLFDDNIFGLLCTAAAKAASRTTDH